MVRNNPVKTAALPLSIPDKLHRTVEKYDNFLKNFSSSLNL